MPLDNAPIEPGDDPRSSVQYLRSVVGDHRVLDFWVFDTTRETNTSLPSERFTAGPGTLSYVAGFAGGRLSSWDGTGVPLLGPIEADCLLSLDSDALSAARAVLLHHALEPGRLAITLDIAARKYEWNAAINVYPYARQTLMLQPIASKANDMRRAFEVALRLEAIDVPRSIATRRIVYDPEREGRINAHYAASSIEESAQARTQILLQEGEPPLWGDLLTTYALVLKMIHVGIDKRFAPLSDKLKIVDDFIREILIQAQPRFFTLARLFFSRRLERLLKTGPGNARFVTQNVIGGVWDIYASTLHESLLGTSIPPKATLSILCTLDSALADYAGRYPLRATMRLDDNTVRFRHDWDDEWLRSVLGESLWRDAVTTANQGDPMRQQVVGDPERVLAEIYNLQHELGIADEDALIAERDGRDIHWARLDPESA